MRYLFFLITFLASIATYSQSTNCVGMEPICTGSGLTFTAQTGVSIGPGANNYDCLFSQPNPSWYYLEIATSGAINMSLSAPSDIDFIIYGPYSSLTNAQNDCGGLGSPAGEVIDCSFSGTNNETPSIPNAVAGQVYVMLITNYANTTQQITLNQTSGAGSTDCSILNPCLITNLVTNISACNPNNNLFTISGSIQFTDAPTSGTLTITDCNGNIQTFNAPFTSPTNYSLSVNSDGTQNCSITAVFSADPTCTITSSTFDYPSGCVCTSDAGTFNENLVGNSNSIAYNYQLCFGDSLFINSNGDFTPPQDFNLAGITYDPGMWLMVYDCPPTLISPNDINNDPCLVGVYSTNDQSWVIPNNTGNNSTLYFVPVTMYSMVDGIYAISINNGNWCYDLGDLYTVTFLPQLIVNAGSDQTICVGETVNLNASGGNTYLWSNGLGANQNITVSPSVNTTYTLTGTSINGCIANDQITVNVNPLPIINAGLDQTICAGSSVILNGSGGNTYVWNNGVVDNLPFNPQITNTYTVTGTDINGCINTDQVLVTVNPIPVVNAGVDIQICQGSTVILTGSGADAYTWDNSVLNGVVFIPNVGSTTYTVIGETAEGCQAIDSVVVFVGSNPVPTFTPDLTYGCAPLTVTFTNTTPDPNVCVWSFSNGQTSTSCNPSVTFTQGGCYDVTLTSTNSNGCIGSSTFTNLICVEDLPVAWFTPSSVDVSTLGTSVDFTNMTIGASNYVWSFGDDSALSNDLNPNHVFPDSLAGNYQVVLIAYSPFGCTDTTWSIITVYEELIYYVPNIFTPDGNSFNQTFMPIFKSGFDVYDYNLQIYNRWGEVIFESNNHLVGWDGSYGSNNETGVCQDGLYTWRIEFKINRWDERRVVHGHVNLIR
jgi:gliding motility-associated-like protein